MDPRLALSTKTHAVITVKDNVHFISEKVNRVLTMASLDDMVELDDKTKLKVSMISSIMPLSEYYEQYPDRKPDTSRNTDEGKYREIRERSFELVAALSNDEVKKYHRNMTILIKRGQANSYAHHCIHEALNRRLDSIGETEYSFQEIQEKGFMGIINSADEAGVKAMIRGMDKFLSRNPNSPNAKLLRAKMVEALNKKRNEQNKTSKVRSE